jgi:ABC-2 type transport system permease protein
VSADTRGTADRLGRLVPSLLIGLPLAVLGSVVTVAVVDSWQILPGLLGLSLCVLLASLGVSSVVSAAFPYPAVHPGDSPFAQPQAAGSTGSMVQSFSFLAALGVSAPVVALVLLASFGSPDWYWAALGAGVGIGVAALAIGVRWGGWIVRRNGPELLAFTLQN